jgi:hypothetical protein
MIFMPQENKALTRRDFFKGGAAAGAAGGAAVLSRVTNRWRKAASRLP